jgi:hypothetical protein
MCFCKIIYLIKNLIPNYFCYFKNHYQLLITIIVYIIKDYQNIETEICGGRKRKFILLYWR